MPQQKEENVVKSRLLQLLVAICISAPAVAEPYWIAWEGDDFPENQGWERVWGNWDGPYEGDGAIRTLNDGVMTIDSLYDDGVYDAARIERPGQMDPDPNETFVVEWRLKIDEAHVTDPLVGFSSDDAWNVVFVYEHDHLRSLYEGSASIPFEPNMFHEYRLESTDMRTYRLFIDDECAREGYLIHLLHCSDIAWGDGTQGGAGLHEWDYFRFGVIPEPSMFLPAVLLVAAWPRNRTWSFD